MGRGAIAITLGAALTSPAHAELLGSGSMRQVCGSGGLFEQVELNLFVQGVTFFGRIVDEEDVGATFVIDSGQAFENAVERLTNGVPDVVTVRTEGYPVGGACSVGTSEAIFFTFADLPCLDGVDFRDTAIERLEVHIDAFTLRQGGGSTNYDLRGRLEVHGECVLAMETMRLGQPPNPNALLPGETSAPILGSIWDPRIDHTTFAPAATADFLVVSSSPTNLPHRFGTILCDPKPWHRVEFQETPGLPFVIPIPDDPALAGRTACTQGGSFDAVLGPRLTNALDITIGSY